MITSWHMIPLCIGTKQVSEIEVRFDIAHCGSRGWAPIAVIVEHLTGTPDNPTLRVEMDGSIGPEQSLLGPAIISAASHYFSVNQAEVLEGLGLVHAAE